MNHETKCHYCDKVLFQFNIDTDIIMFCDSACMNDWSQEHQDGMV